MVFVVADESAGSVSIAKWFTCSSALSGLGGRWNPQLRINGVQQRSIQLDSSVKVNRCRKPSAYSSCVSLCVGTMGDLSISRSSSSFLCPATRRCGFDWLSVGLRDSQMMYNVISEAATTAAIRNDSRTFYKLVKTTPMSHALPEERGLGCAK